MNDALCRGAWDKGRTDIMYMTIEYLNYPIITLLTQPRGNCVNVFEKFEFPLQDLNTILTTATQCVTIELRRPFNCVTDRHIYRQTKLVEIIVLEVHINGERAFKIGLN